MNSFLRGKTGRTALCGVLAAASLVLLLFACTAPSGRLGLAAMAGLFPVGAVLMTGNAGGYLCWAVSGALGLVLLPDKGVAIVYLIFLGLYPVAKSQIEGLQNRPLELLCKLAYFNLALALFWFFLRAVFWPSLPNWIEGQTWLAFVLGNGVFLVYDIGLSRLIGLIQLRLRRIRG